MKTKHITLQRISSGDTSSLAIEPEAPQVLRITGVLPHNCQVTFDRINALALRAWLDGIIAPTLFERAMDFARALENASPPEVKQAHAAMGVTASDFAMRGTLRVIAANLQLVLKRALP
jgi:hypothetical protein